jgi:hypothetical protein
LLPLSATLIFRRVLADRPGTTIPVTGSGAAAFWVRQEWSDTTAEERQRILEYVAAYLNRGSARPLPLTLSRRLSRIASGTSC